MPGAEGHPFQLRSFATSHVEPGVITFLASQPSIVKLRMPVLDDIWSDWSRLLPPGLLPNVVHVSVPPTFYSIMSHRPIASVSTMVTRPSDVELLRTAITESTGSVRKLTLDFISSKIPSSTTLSTLSTSLSELENLTISLVPGSAVRPMRSRRFMVADVDMQCFRKSLIGRREPWKATVTFAL